MDRGYLTCPVLTGVIWGSRGAKLVKLRIRWDSVRDSSNPAIAKRGMTDLVDISHISRVLLQAGPLSTDCGSLQIDQQ